MPTVGDSTVTAVEAAVRADPGVGIVGLVDQAAGYQEFLTLFRGTNSENQLAQQQIPPSLRVFVGASDDLAWRLQVQSMPGVLRVTVGTANAPSSAAELNPIHGLFDIGTVVYEQSAWASSCTLRPWSLNHPALD